MLFARRCPLGNRPHNSRLPCLSASPLYNKMACWTFGVTRPRLRFRKIQLDHRSRQARVVGPLPARAPTQPTSGSYRLFSLRRHRNLHLHPNYHPGYPLDQTLRILSRLRFQHGPASWVLGPRSRQSLSRMAAVLNRRVPPRPLRVTNHRPFRLAPGRRPPKSKRSPAELQPRRRLYPRTQTTAGPAETGVPLMPSLPSTRENLFLAMTQLDTSLTIYALPSHHTQTRHEPSSPGFTTT